MHLGFPGGSDSKESACSAGDPGSIPESERSSEEGPSNPHQCSCLENPMDRRAWQARVHEAARAGHDWATNTHVRGWLWVSPLYRRGYRGPQGFPAGLCQPPMTVGTMFFKPRSSRLMMAQSRVGGLAGPVRGQALNFNHNFGARKESLDSSLLSSYEV